MMERIGVLADLAKKAPDGAMGRTALMKMCYFLQTLHKVPLGYNFTLYSYGPFDSAVLSDLGDAEALGVVREELKVYGSGYGYSITSNIDENTLNFLGGELLKKYRGDIDWVIEEFGSHNASTLELLSTIVFVDREVCKREKTLTAAELARRVREVKPRFTEDRALAEVKSLNDKGLLKAVPRVMKAG